MLQSTFRFHINVYTEVAPMQEFCNLWYNSYILEEDNGILDVPYYLQDQPPDPWTHLTSFW